MSVANLPPNSPRGQLSRHAEVGQPFNFRHLGLSVWIISQDDAGEGVEAFHRTQGGIKVQNDGLFGMNRPYRESDPFSGMEFGTLDERIEEGDPDDPSIACSSHPCDQ